MSMRLDYLSNPLAGKVIRQVLPATTALHDSSLPGATQELVALRVSQINGCGPCIDMHVKEASAAGEDPIRLHLVAAWREATVFTEQERIALQLAEEGTRVADAGEGVSDDTWARAAEFYDDEQLAALVLLVSFMNMFNRFNIITQMPAGSYRPRVVAATG